MRLTQRHYTTTNETLRRMKKLVGRRAGIIREVFPVEQLAPFDVFHYYNAALGNTLHLGGKWALPWSYGGMAWTRAGALAATIGEAVERYACGIYDEGTFLFSAYRDVADHVISLEHLVLLTPEQYAEQGVAPPSPDTRLYWVKGYSLTRQQEVLVPAGLVFVPYQFGAGEDRIIGESTSTGAACGGSLEEAILSGIHENVERDAMMITWLNQLPAPHVCVETIAHPIIADVRRRIASTGYRLVVNDITTDIPLATFLATLVNEDDAQPYSVVAAACGLDKHRALLKAIIEVLQGIQVARTLLERHPEFTADHPVRTLEEHTLLYAKFDLRERLAFLLDSPATQPWEAIPHWASGEVCSDIETGLRLLAEHGHEVIAVDITPLGVRECGLFVVKTIVPGLTPLHSREACRPLGVQRVKQVPVALGYGPREINFLPHPFP
jgi:ribosomal protein S12 methylthiotransferase accessory factor